MQEFFRKISFKYVKKKIKKNLYSPELTWYSKMITRFKSETAKGVAARSAYNRQELDTEYSIVVFHMLFMCSQWYGFVFLLALLLGSAMNYNVIQLG